MVYLASSLVKTRLQLSPYLQHVIYIKYTINVKYTYLYSYLELKIRMLRFIYCHYYYTTKTLTNWLENTNYYLLLYCLFESTHVWNGSSLFYHNGLSSIFAHAVCQSASLSLAYVGCVCCNEPGAWRASIVSFALRTMSSYAVWFVVFFLSVSKSIWHVLFFSTFLAFLQTTFDRIFEVRTIFFWCVLAIASQSVLFSCIFAWL